MAVIWTIFALVVPWAAGTALVAVIGVHRRGMQESPLTKTAEVNARRAFCSENRRSNILLAIGAGWLAGQAMMMVAVFISLLVFGSGHALIVLGILAIVTLIGIALAARKHRPFDAKALHDADANYGADTIAVGAAAWKRRWLTIIRRVVLAIIAASLLAKLYLLICSHAMIPVRGDDAISIWLFKAKVIGSLDRLELDPGQDYYMGGSNPHYSVFVPLVAAWVSLVTGQWHERLVTLPWLLFYVNLILLIAGGLRPWLRVMHSWIAAYLVASLPLMVIHAYRPGYADIILAAFLAGAVLYLLIWRETNLTRHLALAAFFAIIAACLKRESPAPAAIAILALLLPSWRNLRAWSGRMRVGALAVTAVAVLIVAGVVDFSEQAAAAAKFGYHPGIWARLWQHLFEWSSFHFLFWALAAAAVLLSCFRHESSLVPAVLLTLGLGGFHAAVFVLTPQARFALNDQTPSRLFLHLAPALVLAWAIPLSRELNRSAEAVPRALPAGEHKEAIGGQI